MGGRRRLLGTRDATGRGLPGLSELAAGEFALDLDQDDTTSGSGLLYRVRSVWPLAKARLWLNQSPDLAADYQIPTGNIKVVYTAGDLPSSVTLAANMTIATLLAGNQTGVPIQSEAYSDYNRTLASFATSGGLSSIIPPQALALLAKKRELAW